MILIYPEEFKENVPTNMNVDVRFYEKNVGYHVEDNGFYDTVVLVVSHDENNYKLNYYGGKSGGRNIHQYTTFVDCRFDSNNLRVVIDKFKTIEEIWNNER